MDENLTQLGNDVGGWITNNQELIISYAVNLTAALLIILVGSMVIRLATNSLNRLLKARKVDPTIANFATSLIKYALLAFVVIAALGRVGVQTASFVAIVGAAGLAIGLALQGSLSNFAAGVLLIGFRPFKAGDFIEAAGTAGVVESVQIFTTVLKTGDNRIIVVPNSNILGGNIINYSKEERRRIDLVIGVSYDADLQKTKQVLQQIIEQDERILTEPGCTIAVNELGASSVDFIVRPWVNTADFWAVRWDLLEKIKQALDANDIGIPYPQMDVHLIREEKSA
ncbi:Small-conductance mechanosensitive channel [Nitrincola lacisaponensis]|uniref:Small-conductance mechanosensitive channel n=1 Tax=Nitrincola lacisaponensis TaxID=267850 RepID=A0A063XWQ4_9GAMM|nr:small-conductance mechanosensitive channel MscS [Nitrincola lacisaponensis]KDE38638.1 Small-conductance mechanosensitive channel [Nitrincola lacisaponensis]